MFTKNVGLNRTGIFIVSFGIGMQLILEIAHPLWHFSWNLVDGSLSRGIWMDDRFAKMWTFLLNVSNSSLT